MSGIGLWYTHLEPLLYSMKCFLKNKHENCNISVTHGGGVGPSRVNALLRLECIVRLLKETSADDTGPRAVSARGILAQIDAEFVYLLHFFSEILGKIHIVSQQLQDKQADLGKAVKLISSLNEDLADMRNSNLIEQYSEKVTELRTKCCISPLMNRSRRRKPRQLDEFIVLETTGQRYDSSHVQHSSILYEVLDCLISELDRRFTKDSSAIFCGISALCPRGQTFLSEQNLKAFAVAYSVNQSDLKHEIPIIYSEKITHERT
ncbi:hypothetical protein GWK47_022395 [Chionoecetes opilio]|uniref:Uncharacterized protein n=1 Tax=Chionoecetes opilio TaxID=41210 RepID=A0A8J4XWY6_CHIOP|nr:hypothetical protein GWK47_022395 [Chionoecetes opilio]